MFARIICLYVWMVVLSGFVHRAFADTLEVDSARTEAGTASLGGASRSSSREMTSRDWYNRGVDALKQGDVAKGILSFERAMLTEPSNKTIRDGLRLAYSSSVGVQSAMVEVPSSPLDGLCYVFSLPVWIAVALLCFALSLASFVCYRFAPSIGRQKVCFSLSLGFFALCLLANASIAHQLYYHQQREDRLIVMTATPIYSEPHEGDDTALQILPVGAPLTLEEVEGEWCRVRLSSVPTSVWTPATFVESVRESSLSRPLGSE